MDTETLWSLRNLGPASARMLQAAGINSVGQLRSMGSVAAYVAVKNACLAPSLNLLWALEGALTDRDWKDVAKNDRTALLMQLDDQAASRPRPSKENA